MQDIMKGGKIYNGGIPSSEEAELIPVTIHMTEEQKTFTEFMASRKKLNMQEFIIRALHTQWEKDEYDYLFNLFNV